MSLKLKNKAILNNFGLCASVMAALQEIASTHVPFRLTPP